MKLADIPTTNLRIVTSLALAVVYVLALIVMLAFGVKLDADVVSGIGWIILGMLGIDAAQFAAKRFSFKPPVEPPVAQ